MAVVNPGVDTLPPTVDLLPVQPPDATHVLALVAAQVSFEAPPFETVLGLATRLTVGAGVLTDTDADCVALPPSPEQVSVKVELLVSAPVDCEPCVLLLPDQAPDAVQDAALVVDQVKVALSPLVTALGPTLKDTVGAAALIETVAVCSALPPVPVQVNR